MLKADLDLIIALPIRSYYFLLRLILRLSGNNSNPGLPVTPTLIPELLLARWRFCHNFSRPSRPLATIPA